MENTDPQIIMAALAVGGAIMFGAMKLFAGSPVEPTQKPAEKQINADDSKKKVKKKKVKKEKPVKPEIKEEKPVVEKSTKQKKAVKKEIAEIDPPKPAEKVQEQEDVSQKKKKKKKKKKPAKKSESDSSDVEQSKPVESPTNVSKKPLRASDLVKDHNVVESGWETVPVKQRKKAFDTSAVPETEVSPSNKKDDAGKKKVRETINIGEYASVILGEGGSTISNIQNMSGARVNVNREQNICVITGDAESVAVAREFIESLISNQTKQTITVSSRLDKAILGKTDTMKRIRDLSGAKVDYNFGGKDDPLNVTIVGEVDKVEHAKQLIEDYLEGKTPEGLDGIRRIQVNGFQGRILIGQKGAQITELQKQSGASINVEFVEDENKALVSVIGTQEQIDAGLESIRRFLAEHMFSAVVHLEQEARPVLLKLNDLRKQIPNLKVDVNNDRTEINLTGTEEGVTSGRSLLTTWIQRELGPPELKSGEVMEEIDLGSAAGKVIGKNRSVLSHLLKNGHGAKVEIKQGTLCYVYGSPTSVKKVAGEINDIISKHEQVLAKSAEEQEQLESANWVVLGRNDTSGVPGVAPASDWGGFRLAQSQKW